MTKGAKIHGNKSLNPLYGFIVVSIGDKNIYANISMMMREKLAEDRVKKGNRSFDRPDRECRKMLKDEAG